MPRGLPRPAPLVALVLALGIPAFAHGAVLPLDRPAPPVQRVAPGIAYERQVRPGPQVVHVLRAAPSPLTGLAPVLTAGAVLRRGGLAEAVRARGPSGAVAGVNGDFFNSASGYPSGVLVTEGQLVSEPEASRSALVLGPGAALAAARLSLSGRWRGSDPLTGAASPVRVFDGVNRPPETGSETILYTPALGGAATPTGGSVAEARILLDAGGPLGPNQSRGGTVVGVKTGGGSPVGDGEVVLAGIGADGPAIVRELPPGERVLLTSTVVGLPADAAAALGGGPLLVQGGQAVTDAGEGLSSAQLLSRTPRTSVGQTADGTALLVTAEGPPQGSVGLTVAEQAGLMAGLGAATAIGMDGGGSAQMVLGDAQLVPASGTPREIVDGLVLSYGGLRLAPLPAWLSPNADGVRDRTPAEVRVPVAGAVRVTVAGASGRPVRRLLDEPLGPSARRVALDPARQDLPDGRYVMVARLTPADGSPATEERRAFTVDRALATLRVRPVALREGRRLRRAVRVSFRLLRGARVTVKALDSAGATLRTVASGRVLGRGRQTLEWDRRSRGDLVSGAVQIAVEARTRRGVTGLVTPFTLAPPPEPPRRPRP